MAIISKPINLSPESSLLYDILREIDQLINVSSKITGVPVTIGSSMLAGNGTGGFSNVTVQNALTFAGNILSLGGPLVQSTVIDLSTHPLTIGSITASGAFNVITGGGLNFTTNSGGNGFVFTDNAGSGFSYTDGDNQGGFNVISSASCSIGTIDFLNHTRTNTFSITKPGTSFGGNLTLETGNTNANNIQNAFQIFRKAGSTTPAIGIGAKIKFLIQNSSHANTSASIAYSLTNVTPASEQGKYAFTLNAGNANETLIVELDRFGFKNNADFSASQTARYLTDQGYVLGAKTFTGKQTFGLPPIMPTYTVLGVPSAATYIAGIIYVSDEVGGPTLAFSDSVNWRRVQDRNIIS